MTDIHRTTILKLLVDLGAACAAYQRKMLVNLPCKRVQCDEIWLFVGAKEKNASEERKAEGRGGAWTWVALDADTKLVPCWSARRWRGDAFIHDLKNRLANRVQLTTDGNRAYLNAVEDAFGAEVDYAMLAKIYGEAHGGEVRYSPSEVTGAVKTPVCGCRCAGLPGSRTPFQRSWRTTKRRLPFTTCITISRAFTRLSVSLLRWKQAFPATFGRFRKSLLFWKVK